MDVSGWTAPGYERVAEAMDGARDELGEGGGAFAATVGGEPVVDVWTGWARDGVPWERDTTAVIMSATKGVVAIAVHMLIDRGLLDVDATVASYWPEFAQAGKERVTVRQVLSHTAGVITAPLHLRLDGRNWGDHDAIVDAVAASEPVWEPGTRHGYHALTFGWICGELIRRIDGRTLGRFVREEICEPLDADLWIGAPPDVAARTAHVRIGPPPPDEPPAMAELRALFNDPSTPSGKALLAKDGANVLTAVDAFMNDPRNLALEIGSSNGVSTARAIARIYAALCDGLVSRDALARMGEVQAEGPDGVLTFPGRWTLGFQNLPAPPPPMLRAFGPDERSFGHGGAGGQIGFVDPHARISAAFVRNQLGLIDTGAKLVHALYACLG